MGQFISRFENTSFAWCPIVLVLFSDCLKMLVLVWWASARTSKGSGMVCLTNWCVAVGFLFWNWAWQIRYQMAMYLTWTNLSLVKYADALPRKWAWLEFFLMLLALVGITGSSDKDLLVWVQHCKNIDSIIGKVISYTTLLQQILVFNTTSF